jgi:hypothetical protein
MLHYRPNTFAQTTFRSSYPLAVGRRTIHSSKWKVLQELISPADSGRMSLGQAHATDGTLSRSSRPVPSNRLLCAVKKGPRIVPVRAVGD